MAFHTLEPYLTEHPFFAGLDQPYIELLTGCARNVRFDAGETIFRQGGEADNFYLLRHGRVAIEVPAPQGGSIVIDSLDPGDVFGASWIVAPYRWHFDARALDQTRAVALDATCLRGKCEADPRLGYELLKRFAVVLQERLRSAQLQLVDIYANPAAREGDA